MTTYAHSPALQQSLAAWARTQLAVEQQLAAEARELAEMEAAS